MKPYFKLRPYKDADGLQQLQLYYYNKGQQLLLDSTVKTKQIYWNPDKQEISSRATEIKQNPFELNKKLREKFNKLDKIILDYQNKHDDLYPDIQYVKDEFYKEHNKILKDREVKDTFKEFVIYKTSKVEDARLYTTVYNSLVEYHPKPLYFRNITIEFIEGLINSWVKKGCQNSTINRRWKTLKAFLDANSPDFKMYSKYKTELTVPKKKIVIPTLDEFKILQTKNIVKKHLDDARDLYIIGCCTGLRYSDIIKLKPNNIIQINNSDYISTTVKKKQQEELLIPLNQIGKKFLTKQFNKGGIKKLSSQKLNDNLYTLFKDMEFNQVINKMEKSGSTTKIVEYFKYDLLTIHTSRKFFISYLVNSKKVGLGNVMKWSGHTSRTVESYIQQGFDEENQMREAFV